MDEDVPDDSESRDQRRHIERKNTNQRKKKKTEDTARLRKLVQNCQDLDERIKAFLQAERLQKNKKRMDREAQQQKDAEEAQKKKEEEARLLVEQEAAAKVEKADAKKSKEAAKTAIKKNRRVIRGAVKDANYFADGKASAAQIDQSLNDVDALLAKIDAEETAELAGKLNGKTKAPEIQAVFVDEAKRLQGTGVFKEGELKSIPV